MSPDNYVQDTKNTQCYNRFGYVVNNPLLYTDVSGKVFGIDDAIIIAIAVSVAMNAVNNIVHDVPFWYGMGKAAVIGAASGAISFEIGEIATSAFNCATMSVGKALFEAGLHGFTGGLMSEVDGSSFASGFAAGAVSALVSAGVEGLAGQDSFNFTANGSEASADGAGTGTWQTSFGTNHPELVKSMMIASGGLAGGISSSIAGGNFWAGMRQGLITSGLNEAAHMVVNYLEERSTVKAVLKHLNLRPGDKAPKTYGSLSLLKSDPMMNAQFMSGGSPILGEQLIIDTDKEYGWNDYFGSSDAETNIFGNGNITMYGRAFSNWRTLAYDLVHELQHRSQWASGKVGAWMAKFHGDRQITWNMAEYDAHLTVVNWGYTYPAYIRYLDPYKDFVNTYYPGTIK